MTTVRRAVSRWALRLLERNLLAEGVLRLAIRRLLAERLEECADNAGDGTEKAFVDSLASSPVALSTAAANEQHYEVPAELFQRVLGARMKYSSGFWAPGCRSLDEAEEAMLALSADRAEVADGQDILELGCGWGSMTLWLAERYPRARILGVSNSASQKAHVDAAASRSGLSNVEIVTADMNHFTTERRFDRIVSIEMFEHMRNYQELFNRLQGWLRPGGKLFVHVFCHRLYTYPFEDRDESDWMARHFFTGGLMPSATLLPSFASPLRLERSWVESGTHYQRTAEAWLANLESGRDAILPILEATYGADERVRWWAYWRVFFLACAELFGYRGGEEWGVAHYRFRLPAHESQSS